MKKAKIIATVGPASRNKGILKELLAAGVNLFRVNFSHAQYEEVDEFLNLVREIEKETGKYIGIIADLQGPKIRVGKINGIRVLHSGEEVFLENVDIALSEDTIPLPCKEFFQSVQVGNILYINDGLIKLEVVEIIGPEKVKCSVKTGGLVSTHKGVNLPDTVLHLSPLTAKDLKDLEYIVKKDFSYVALSFVQRPEDIEELRKKLEGTEIGIIAKIEKKKALDNIKDIIRVADAVMVARGDLGIEVELEKLPYWQRKIIDFSRFYSKPVIVATQMLESMIENAIPTRAEVNDIASAVLEGADALMLSGETAMGKYPVEVVKWMSKIILNTEKEMIEEKLLNWKNLQVEEAVSRASVISARAVHANYIVATTMSGRTAMLISKLHSPYTLIAFSPREATLKKSALFWGTLQLEGEEVHSLEELVKEIKEKLRKEFPAESREIIVITGGFPFEHHSETNFLLIEKC